MISFQCFNEIHSSRFHPSVEIICFSISFTNTIFFDWPFSVESKHLTKAFTPLKKHTSKYSVTLAVEKRWCHNASILNIPKKNNNNNNGPSNLSNQKLFVLSIFLYTMWNIVCCWLLFTLIINDKYLLDFAIVIVYFIFRRFSLQCFICPKFAIICDVREKIIVDNVSSALF